MDALRQIRFLIPPFFLFGAIAAVAFADTNTYNPDLQFLSNNLTTLIAIVVAGVLPAGFVISGITFLLLEGLVRLLLDTIWQARLTEEEYDKINTLLIGASPFLEESKDNSVWKASTKLNLLITFHHGLVRQTFPDVSASLVRTYSAFLVSLNSQVALVIAAIFVCATDLNPHWSWCLVMFLLFVLLTFSDLITYRDYNSLLRFMVKNYASMKTRFEPPRKRKAFVRQDRKGTALRRLKKSIRCRH